MTDVARTLASMQSLLADNTTGAISAQDVRDLMLSLASPLIGGGFDEPGRVHGIHENVKHHGAIGDGVADDTAAIQAAIDAVGVQVGSLLGGAVYFPRGTYKITSPLLVSFLGNPSGRNTTDLLGVGFNASIIKWGGVADHAATTGMIKFHNGGEGAVNGEGALVEGLGFDGGGVASKALYLTDTNVWEFARLGFNNFTAGTNGACFYIASGSGNLLNTIRNCFFNGGNNYGIYIAGGFANGTRIINNEFAATRPGSLYANASNIIIEGNYFEGLLQDSTNSITCVGGTRVANNWFEDVTESRPNAHSIEFLANSVEFEVCGNHFNLSGGPNYGIVIGTNSSEAYIHGNVWANPCLTANIQVASGCDDVWVMFEPNAYSSGPNNQHVEDNSGNVIEGFNRIYGRGFKRVAINKPYPQVNPDAHLDVNGQAFTNGVSTFVKAGAPNDGDFTYVRDGMTAVDSTNNRFYVRVGGVWKYATLT